MLTRKNNERSDMHAMRVKATVCTECTLNGNGTMRLLRFKEKGRWKKGEIHW